MERVMIQSRDPRREFSGGSKDVLTFSGCPDMMEQLDLRGPRAIAMRTERLYDEVRNRFDARPCRAGRTNMATETRKKKAGDRGRRMYRFTADQVMEMVEAGIVGRGEDLELWDGILYKMTKGELHSQIVMMTYKALDRVADPDAYHVRPQVSNSDGPRSLPEPDIAVARGVLGVMGDRPPALERVALVVEVDHHTAHADRVVKFARYAARRIPIYWIVKAKKGIVHVFEGPEGEGKAARYTRRQSYSGNAEIPIVIDGREVGRVVASKLFPVRQSP
jgi:hypothetical protein